MINWTDFCCGLTFPIIIIVISIILLFLRKKGFFMKFRKLNDDNDAVIVISRLFAIGIPVIIVTSFHACNALGIEVWEPLLSISIGMVIIFTGLIIAVLGLKVGFYFPIILVVGAWILAFYMYIQFEANII